MDYYYAFSMLANIAAIISFCVLIWVTVQVYLSKKRIEKRMILLEKSDMGGLSRRPAAIVIGIGKNPLTSAKKFMDDCGWTDIPIIDWISEGFLQAKDYSKAMDKINDLRKQALELGVSEVLLFYAGPLDLAMHIGASFSDWVPIKVYAFTDTGTYEQRITLRRETAKSLTMGDELGRELERNMMNVD